MCQFVGMLLFNLKTFEIQYVNIWSADSLEEAREILDKYVNEMVKKPMMYDVVETKNMKEL